MLQCEAENGSRQRPGLPLAAHQGGAEGRILVFHVRRAPQPVGLNGTVENGTDATHDWERLRADAKESGARPRGRCLLMLDEHREGLVLGVRVQAALAAQKAPAMLPADTTIDSARGHPQNVRDRRWRAMRPQGSTFHRRVAHADVHVGPLLNEDRFLRKARHEHGTADRIPEPEFDRGHLLHLLHQIGDQALDVAIDGALVPTPPPLTPAEGMNLPLVIGTASTRIEAALRDVVLDPLGDARALEIAHAADEELHGREIVVNCAAVEGDGWKAILRAMDGWLPGADAHMVMLPGLSFGNLLVAQRTKLIPLSSHSRHWGARPRKLQRMEKGGARPRARTRHQTNCGKHAMHEIMGIMVVTTMRWMLDCSRSEEAGCVKCVITRVYIYI